MTAAVAVTGASGFIGRHLMHALLASEREVIALTRNKARLSDMSHQRLRVFELDYRSTEDVAARLPEGATVVHLAALRNAPGATRQSLLKANVDATAAIASAALRRRTQRFLHLGTLLMLDRSGSTDAYVDSKRRGLAALEAMNELPLVTLLPSIVYGPDWPQARNRMTSHVRRLLTRPWRVSIGSEAPRDLVFVDDVVNAILRLETEGVVRETFAVRGEEMTHEQFEQAVYRAAGRDPAKRITVPAAAARVAATAMDALLGMRDGCGWRARVDSLLTGWTFSVDVPDVETIGVKRTPFDVGIARTIRAVGVR